MSKMLSILIMIAAAVSFTSCDFKDMDSVRSAAGSQTVLAESLTVTAQEISENEYSVDDVINLKDFLLTGSDLSEKSEYDLNGDDLYNVFDLCLMKQAVLEKYHSTENDENILVTYFSATGTTEVIADFISGELDAELYEIIPAVPYTAEDLDYTDPQSRTSKERDDDSSRPEISGEIPDISEYDTIFIGYPIWHGQAPKIISTFLESTDFTGKTVIPYCTSASSPIGSSGTNLHLLAPGADWADGRRFSGTSTQNDIAQWIGELNSEELSLMYYDD